MNINKSLLLILCVFVCLLSNARVYQGTPKEMIQPDGKSVTVYLYGTDVYIDAESEDHYTLIKDEKTGAICYAMLSADGNEYASTGIVYEGGEIPERVKSILQPKLRISKEKRDQIIEERKRLLGKELGSATLKAGSVEVATVLPDTVYGVCVLIDFQDVKSDVSREQIEIFLNSDDQTVFGNSMSIKKYFSWISGGKLTYINYVPKEFYTAPQSKSYYSPLDATDYTTRRFFPVIEAALKSYTRAKDGFDVRDLSKRNSSGSIRAINVLYAGSCNNEWATGLWPHQGSFLFDLSEFGISRSVLHTYQISDIGKELTMGTFVHENGHLVCDWPDFYSYDGHSDNNSKKYNIGDAFWIANEKNPPYPNPWALDQLGWLTNRIDITNVHDGRLIELKKECGCVAVYQGNGKNKKERFYIEIRDHHYNYDSWSYRTDNGIFIWHSNDAGDNTYENRNELLDCRPATVRNPFWSSSCGPAVFDDNSNPNAKWVDGTNSGIYLCDFSQAGATMTFRCGPKIENPKLLRYGQLNSGGLKSSYKDSLYCEGGDAPYRYAIVAGSLPDGLWLDESGLISGEPEKLGDFSFKVSVTDKNGKRDEQDCVINIITSNPYDDVFLIPGGIEMEYFDLGGQGVAYNDVDEKNEGVLVRDKDEASVYMQKFNSQGYSIKQTEAGEWTQYSVSVTEDALMQLSIRYSTEGEASVGVYLNDEKLGTLHLVGRKGMEYSSRSRGYDYVTDQFDLKSGEYKLRYVVESLTAPLYTDSVKFEVVDVSGNAIANSSSNVILYSDCNKGDFIIQSSNSVNRLEVYSVNGILIDDIEAVSGDFCFGYGYGKGVYFVRMYTEDGVFVKKVLKE